MKHAPDDYALVIGINDYPRWNAGAKTLNGSIKDAEAFHEWLIDDDGGGLPEENVKLVRSSGDPLAPRQFAIDDAFREIREQSASVTRRRFYFYFSGHGHSRAGSWQQQSLCLANWSPADAGAALHLESYIKAAVGCLKFEEAVFLLDCCRVRAIVPLGQQSELECGDPDTRNRYSAVLFGSDQYEPTYEGEVEGEVRGYFTTGLLKVLREGTIELGELIRRLRIIVPEIAGKDRNQTVRAIPADRDIFLGPPDRQPPPAAVATPGGTDVTISVRTNLVPPQSPEEPPVQRPGDISILQEDRLVAHGLGWLHANLAPGKYRVRIDHAEAFETHDLDVGMAAVQQTFDLPRRTSAALLSSTRGKREWLTYPAMGASKWEPAEGEQAVFVSLRPPPPRAGELDAPGYGPVMPETLKGSLELADPNGVHYPIGETNSLIPVPAGSAELIHIDEAGNVTHLPVPVALGWDTHVFLIVGEDGTPQLAGASVSMRKAGLGFDPSDALIDAYERAVADLVTGGPGPDHYTLESLLWGKYRNPLFGLVGAHFLIRTLRRSAAPDPYDLERLSTVIGNLSGLLGEDAPDIVALRLLRRMIAGWPVAAVPPTHQVPLLNVAFQACIEATATSVRPSSGFDRAALGLDAGSPWSVWRDNAAADQLSAYQEISTARADSPDRHRTYTYATVDGGFSDRIDRVADLWRRHGFELQFIEGDERRQLVARRLGSAPLNVFDQADTILRVPESLVHFVRDAREQSLRTNEPFDVARIVRRTMLPRSVIETALLLADASAGDEAMRRATGNLRQESGAATAPEAEYLSRSVPEAEARGDGEEDGQAMGAA